MTDKPDLFEMGVIELLLAYRKLWAQGGFAWPTISAALDHILAATKLLEEGARKADGGDTR